MQCWALCYPGDIVDAKGERGASMYEMFKPTDYNLADADQNMLQYQIDTYGGEKKKRHPQIAVARE